MQNRFTSGGNPVLRNVFSSPTSSASYEVTSQGVMTAQGAINKTFILFGIMLITAIFNYQAQNSLLMICGAIIGLILVIINVFKREYSPYIAPAYAAVEGLLVGGISGIYAGFGGGIVVQAI